MNAITENERVRILRKELGLTLIKMGEALKISDAAVSMIETGKSAVTDRTRSAIVREFGVSETWLRTGEGEMFPPMTRQEELAKFFNRVEQVPDSFQARFVQALAELDEAQWQLIADMVEKLVENRKDPGSQ